MPAPRPLGAWPDRFCPVCGGRLLVRRAEGRRRALCRTCGRIAYRNPKPCAGALLERAGKVLLVRRSVPPFRGWWDIPGGFLEEDEHPENAAIREVREETGLRARLRELFGLYMDRYETSSTLNLYYRAEVAGGRPRPGDDAAALGWFGPDELPERIAYPRHARRVLDDWADLSRP